ncbi:hypothetical protein ACROSR_09725 [Roseovarius tibetensis]|uniref:hypothetical protein n=1 Tax=Roseovarius tibetensis TaxID=2685897 RepID=UPI003D7F8D35
MKWRQKLRQHVLTREEVIVNRTQGGKELRAFTGRRIWRPIPWVAYKHPLVALIVVGSLGLSCFAIVAKWPELFQRVGAVTLVAGFFFQFVAANRFKSVTEKEFFDLFLRVMDSRAQEIAAQEIYDKQTRTQRTADLGQSEDMNRAFANISQAHRPHRFLEGFLVVLGTFQVTAGDWFLCSWYARELTTC